MEKPNIVWVHKDVKSEIRNGASLRQQVEKALQNLSTGSNLDRKPLKPPRGWFREELGGKRKYLYWTHSGTQLIKDAGWKEEPNNTVFVRSIEHHDNNKHHLEMSLGNRDHYKEWPEIGNVHPETEQKQTNTEHATIHKEGIQNILDSFTIQLEEIESRIEEINENFQLWQLLQYDEMPAKLKEISETLDRLKPLSERLEQIFSEQQNLPLEQIKGEINGTLNNFRGQVESGEKRIAQVEGDLALLQDIPSTLEQKASQNEINRVKLELTETQRIVRRLGRERWIFISLIVVLVAGSVGVSLWSGIGVEQNAEIPSDMASTVPPNSSTESNKVSEPTQQAVPPMEETASDALEASSQPTAEATEAAMDAAPTPETTFTDAPNVQQEPQPIAEEEEIPVEPEPTAEVNRLLEPEPTVPVELETPKPTIQVTVGVANLRAGPGTEYNPLGQVRQDDLLTVWGRNENADWLQIDQEGNPYWIFADLTTISEEELGSVPVVDAPVAP